MSKFWHFLTAIPHSELWAPSARRPKRSKKPIEEVWAGHHIVLVSEYLRVAIEIDSWHAPNSYGAAARWHASRKNTPSLQRRHARPRGLSQ